MNQQRYVLLGQPNPAFEPETFGWRDGKLLKNPVSTHPLRNWAGQLKILEGEYREAICGNHNPVFVENRVDPRGNVYSVFLCKKCSVERYHYNPDGQK
jgi:hypothetical protein